MCLYGDVKPYSLTHLLTADISLLCIKAISVNSEKAKMPLLRVSAPVNAQLECIFNQRKAKRTNPGVYAELQSLFAINNIKQIVMQCPSSGIAS